MKMIALSQFTSGSTGGAPGVPAGARGPLMSMSLVVCQAGRGGGEGRTGMRGSRSPIQGPTSVE